MEPPLDVRDIEGVSERGFMPHLHTPRRDAFTSVVQDKASYLTTTEFAREMGVHEKQVHRWCLRWYGALPPARQVKGMGYRIHPYMRRVARGWLQTQDPGMRFAIQEAIAKEEKDWVVVVAKAATTHYTASEAAERVRRVIQSAVRNKGPIAVVYVGESPN